MPARVRLGLQVRGTDSGLGTQTRALHRHLRPARTMLVDTTGQRQGPVHRDWYHADVVATVPPGDDDIDRFLEGVDAVLVCESPINYRLFERARELGVSSVLQSNYEYLKYLEPHQEARSLPMPDVFAAPSTWNLSKLPRPISERTVHLPVPIDLDELPRRQVTGARHFFHVAGRPGERDRNGTLIFLEAARIAARRAPAIEFTMYCQAPTPQIVAALEGGPVRQVGHLEDRADLYATGDVLVLPRRYGGLCLPAQEAVGCGIPVIMPDVEPNSSWLPRSWLVPPAARERVAMPSGIRFEGCRVDAGLLAERMLDLAGAPDAVQRMHAEALAVAAAMSWDALLPRYEALLSGELRPPRTSPTASARASMP